MARHSKPKKEQNAPTQTLHDFFNSKPVSSQSAKGKNFVPVRGQEIIVIDSDSDGEMNAVQAGDSKRRKLNPDNVKRPATINKIKDNKVKKESKMLSPSAHYSTDNSTTVVPQVSSAESIQKSRHATSANQEDPLCFGQPSLLLDSSVHERTQEPVSSSFGKPFLLTPSLNDMSKFSESEAVLSLAGSTVPTLPTEETAVDIDLTLDDWEVEDDDEIPLEYKSDDDSDIEFVSFEDMDAAQTSKANAQPFYEGTRENVSLSA